MLNQSFSAETFEEIFNLENRKGKNIEKLFKDDFSESLEHLKKIKDKSLELKKEKDKDLRRALYLERKKLKSERENLLIDVFTKTAKDLPKKIKSTTLVLGPVYGKQTYLLENNIHNFFASKKIQQNILKTYKVKQANRYSIIAQMVNLLEDKFPKYLIRTDINSFYESIPQKPLLRKINEDHLLSELSKRFINKIFEEYNRLTLQIDVEDPKGVPRGVGISPYLSELFMRQIDNKIKKQPDVIFYSRYVDDIIVIFVPENKNVSTKKLEAYKKNVFDAINSTGLSINESKTKTYNLLKGLNTIHSSTKNIFDGVETTTLEIDTDNTIEFLGYEIGCQLIDSRNSQNNKIKITESLTVDISDKKLKKYKEKIKLAFNEYHKKRNGNSKKSLKLLKSRIEYLSSNTRLRNSKSKVLIGIYYSNPFVNVLMKLEKLDRSLIYYLGRANISDSVKLEIKKYNFVNGFLKKKFIQIPISKQVYKNYNSRKSDIINLKNKGVLRYGLKEINSIWRKY